MMMKVVDAMAIIMETLWRDNGCSLEKEIIELINMNP